jgi:hypothetical protein
MFMLPFMEDPAQHRRRMEARARSALAHKLPYPDIKPQRMDRSGHDVGAIASTFKVENPLDGILDTPASSQQDSGVIDASKSLWYRCMRLPLYSGLPIAQANDLFTDAARIFFDAPVVVPSLQFHNGVEWKTWMGLAPAELWSLRSGVQAATGNVVLAGLGMGWLLSQVVKKSSVKSVVVVEKDRNLLDWFGNRLCQKYGVSEIICANIYDVAARFRSHKLLLDIWQDFGDARYDHDLFVLRQTHKVWAWGSARASAFFP